MSYDTTGFTNNSKGLVGGCHVFLAFAMGSGRCRVFGLWAMGRRASTSQLEVKHVLRSEHEHHNIVIIMHTHAIKLIILSRASIQLSSVHSCFLGQWLSWDKYQLYISLILWLHELQNIFLIFELHSLLQRLGRPTAKTSVESLSNLKVWMSKVYWGIELCYSSMVTELLNYSKL